MSEEMRNALNAMLYQTGEQSNNFMMVLATNRPSDLDAAVVDRMDETLEFDVPEEHERHNMIKLYYDTCIRRTDLQIKGDQKVGICPSLSGTGIIIIFLTSSSL
jgi:ATPase family AAA domain-containing protein 3A/B